MLKGFITQLQNLLQAETWTRKASTLQCFLNLKSFFFCKYGCKEVFLRSYRYKLFFLNKNKTFQSNKQCRFKWQALTVLLRIFLTMIYPLWSSYNSVLCEYWSVFIVCLHVTCKHVNHVTHVTHYMWLRYSCSVLFLSRCVSIKLRKMCFSEVGAFCVK